MRPDIEPHLTALITLYPTSMGGRRSPTSPDWLGCPCKVGDDYWDCRLLFGGSAMAPGETRKLGMVFLSDAGAEAVRAAGRFLLWDGRIIGEGTVLPYDRSYALAAAGVSRYRVPPLTGA